MIWIAVDAMDGDEAPRHVVDGAIAATRQSDLGVLLAGPSALIDAELRRHPDAERSRLRVAEAPEVVTMDESRRQRRGANAARRFAWRPTRSHGEAAGLTSSSAMDLPATSR